MKNIIAAYFKLLKGFWLNIELGKKIFKNTFPTFIKCAIFSALILAVLELSISLVTQKLTLNMI